MLDRPAALISVSEKITVIFQGIFTRQPYDEGLNRLLVSIGTTGVLHEPRTVAAEIECRRNSIELLFHLCCVGKGLKTLDPSILIIRCHRGLNESDEKLDDSSLEIGSYCCKLERSALVPVRKYLPWGEAHPVSMTVTAGNPWIFD